MTTGVSLVQIFSDIFLGGYLHIIWPHKCTILFCLCGYLFYKWDNTVCITKQLAFSLNAISWTLSVSACGDLTHYTCKASHSMVHKKAFPTSSFLLYPGDVPDCRSNSFRCRCASVISSRQRHRNRSHVSPFWGKDGSTISLPNSGCLDQHIQ